MSSKTAPDTYEAARIIERQMRLRDARDRALLEKPAATRAQKYHFITISRDHGTRGDAIAELLGARLQWHVFDKEILNDIAENSHVREGLVKELDERAEGLIEDTLGRFLRMAEGGSFGIEDYHNSLMQTMHLLAARGDAILVGRGGNFALAGVEGGFHIRIVGSPEIRSRRLSTRWQLDLEETRRRVSELDEGRRNFIRHHFKQDVDNARFYDQVFNTDRLTPEQVVASVLGALGM
jgi:cytidylate kinase